MVDSAGCGDANGAASLSGMLYRLLRLTVKPVGNFADGLDVAVLCHRNELVGDGFQSLQPFMPSGQFESAVYCVRKHAAFAGVFVSGLSAYIRHLKRM